MAIFGLTAIHSSPEKLPRTCEWSGEGDGSWVTCRGGRTSGRSGCGGGSRGGEHPGESSGTATGNRNMEKAKLFETIWEASLQCRLVQPVVESHLCGGDLDRHGRCGQQSGSRRMHGRRMHGPQSALWEHPQNKRREATSEFIISRVLNSLVSWKVRNVSKL